MRFFRGGALQPQEPSRPRDNISIHDHQHDVPDKPKVKLPKKQDSNIQLGTATHQALALKESDFGTRGYIKSTVKNRFNVDDLHERHLQHH